LEGKGMELSANRRCSIKRAWQRRRETSSGQMGNNCDCREEIYGS
jgi:hypothetical protein